MNSVRGKRGFAIMDPEKQKEIARKGGVAAHEKGSAHEFSPDEAREAGRIGGEKVSSDRARMAEMGRKGGLVAAARRVARKQTITGVDEGSRAGDCFNSLVP